MNRSSRLSGDRLDTILFHSPVVEIGKFRVWPWHPRFRDSGPIERHVVVFPRTLVRIVHEGRDGFIAGPDLVTYYNRGQIYQRESVHDLPDRCEWFAFGSGVLRDALREYHPAASERVDTPFVFSHGPSDSVSYLRQRRVVEALAAKRNPDPMEIEEEMVAVFARLLTALYQLRGEHQPVQDRTRSHRRDRALAEDAKAAMGSSFRRRVYLSDIAAELGVSVFRLCRVFREETGATLHRFRTRLRLAASLERLYERSCDLTEIALDLGFSSHSHFTSAFRRELGVTPSAVIRDRSTARAVRLGWDSFRGSKEN